MDLADSYDLVRTLTEKQWLSDPRSGALYVYLHLDNEGIPFYAGRGRHSVAWKAHGGPAWEWFVKNRMGGECPVYILAAELGEESSEHLLDRVKEHHGLKLLIQSNSHRGMNYQALDAYWQAKRKVKPYYFSVPNEKDEKLRLTLALEAQEFMYEIDSSETEQGRFGEVLRDMGALRDVRPFFLKFIVEGFVLQGRVEEARAALERFRTKAPGHDLSRLERVVQRGTFSRRSPKKIVQVPDGG